MNFYGRFVGLAISLVLVAGLGVTVGASPASATVTTLCKGYARCANAGMSSSGYASANRSMYWRMYAGHNCTNYVAYRMIQAGMPNTRPWTGGGNATHWGTSMSRITNSTPTVGSVAWWRAGVSPAGSSGHVAYVEKVISADEIIVSQDSWGGDFSWARVTRASRGWPSGFVHFRDERQLNTKAPTIAGTAKVGSVLTASPGSWDPSGATFAYQWAQDGVYIPGATAPTLTLTPAHQAKRISVRVTAVKAGYPSAAVLSGSTATVAPGVLTNTQRPVISGDPRVDGTLTASPGTWTPTPDEIRYTWRAEGVEIPGANESTLVMNPSLANKRISVSSIAIKSGYADVSAPSLPTAAVVLGTFRMTTPPTIAGTPTLGETLRLERPSLNQSPEVSVRWLRQGRAIPGATGTSYQVTPDDLGTHISARVRLTRPGYTTLVTRTRWTRTVKSMPVVRLRTRPDAGRLHFSTTVRALGVDSLDGVVRVSSRGRRLGTVRVTDGYARKTLTRLRAGTRVFRFRVPATRTTHAVVVSRRIRIN